MFTNLYGLSILLVLSICDSQESDWLVSKITGLNTLTPSKSHLKLYACFQILRASRTSRKV